MSHKIRSGILAKKTWKDADLFKMFHELTPPQMSFFRECVVQEMGGKKSAFWGHQRIPFKINHKCSKKDLMFFLEATNHPTHIFARKMSINKSAAGYGASIGRAVVKVGRTVGKYAATGAKWMAAHAKQIMGGLDTAIGLGVQGVTMAYQMGALDDESDATLLGLTQAVGMAHQLYHAGDGEEEKKTEKSTEKGGKGGFFVNLDKSFKSPSVQAKMKKGMDKFHADKAEKENKAKEFWSKVNSGTMNFQTKARKIPTDKGGGSFDDMAAAAKKQKEYSKAHPEAMHKSHVQYNCVHSFPYKKEY